MAAASAAGHGGGHQKQQTQQLADAQLSLWWQELAAAAAAVRISAGSSEPEYRGPVCQRCVVESVPVPGRAEAIVGPSLPGMYTVAKGPTALLQKTRRGELDLPKSL